MKFRQFLIQIFPPPRQPVRLKHARPLIAFLLLFLAVILYVEWKDHLLFARPWMFGFAIVMPWVWWHFIAGYSGLSPIRSRVALFVRLALIGAMLIVLAEPRSVKTSDVLSVNYVIDVSDSVGDSSTDRALEFVAQTIPLKPPHDEAGLIAAGRTASVELPPRQSFPLEAESISLNSRIDRDATNLEQALSLAAAVLPAENQGRIVLVSDGTQTEGNLTKLLDELKSRKIAVDVLPIEYDFEQEVWLERLELPRHVKIGENYEASVVLSSLKSGTGRLSLRENGKVIFEDDIDFETGKKRFTIPVKLREPGYYEYSATIQLPDENDHLKQNNTVLNYIYVRGEGRVLVVTDPQGDERDWEPLVKAMREAERNVEIRSSFEFPQDSLSLMPYDAIVFVNAPADVFDTLQLAAVEEAVKDLGIGFLMVGGPNSFGPGGYHRSAIERALPVSMDVTKKKILPMGALAIILHTCEFAEGNTWAKKITKQAIKVLGAKDEVGVLDYEGVDQWVFELTPASEYDALVPQIEAAAPSDMPSFIGCMELGLQGLLDSDAAARHMIIISDGDPQAPPPPLVAEFVDNQVSVSMVAINPHGGVEISKMRAIASVTGGRYYFPQDPNELPAIFIKESKTLKRNMIQNETIMPEVDMPSPIIKGIMTMQPLHGYVLTTPKPKAEVVLRVPVKEEDQVDPILAHWQYGLGTTAAFTSDLSSNWGADWIEWDKYRALVKQLMIRISRVQKEGHLRMWTYATGNKGVVLLEDFHPESSLLQMQARISGPRNQVENVALQQVGPRRYQATIPLWGRGRYQVTAAPVSGDREKERAIGGFIVPYSPEYLRFRSNPLVLDKIVKETGGKFLERDAGGDMPWKKAADDIYKTRRQTKKSSRPVFDWFLIVLACLIPLDVAVRRVQIDWYTIKGWFSLGKKEGPSTATMGSLLQRKKTVATQIQGQRLEVPLPQNRPTTRTAAQRPSSSRTKTDTPAAKAQAEAEKRKSEPADGTTSRLLEMKRKRQQDDTPES